MSINNYTSVPAHGAVVGEPAAADSCPIHRKEGYCWGLHHMDPGLGMCPLSQAGVSGGGVFVIVWWAVGLGTRCMKPVSDRGVGWKGVRDWWMCVVV